MEHVNNNLSLCLAAIAGKVDPNTVKYHNGLEYQLLKIAGMTEESGGGGDDTPSENKYTAKRVTTKWTVTSDSESLVKTATAYMVTVDLGIESIPYEVFGIEADIDGHVAGVNPIDRDTMVSKKFPYEGDTISFSQDDIDASYTLAPRTAAGDLAISYVRAFFISRSESLEPINFKLQMFIYPNTAEEEPPAEKEMTINVTLVENAVEDTGK